MKILLISNMYPNDEYPMFGIFVKNFVNNISNEKVEISKSILIIGKGRNIYQKLKEYIRFYLAIIRAVLGDKYDIVYVHYISYSLIPFLFLRRLNFKNLVLNAHGSDVLGKSKLNRLILTLVTPIILKAELIVVPSEFFKKVICQKIGIKESKVFVYPSGGINTSLFHPAPKDKHNYENRFVIGLVSRIDKGKGWDVLLKAMKILLTKYNVKTIIIGGGNDEAQLRKTIIEYNLSNQVNFIGTLNQTHLPYYYSQMDVFVFPTEFKESLGLVGLEAMACGVPVVGSNIGGLTSYIKSGFNGEFFKVGDHVDLANKVENFILMNSVQINKFRKNARATAIEYDAIATTQRLFNKLISLGSTV